MINKAVSDCNHHNQFLACYPEIMYLMEQLNKQNGLISALLPSPLNTLDVTQNILGFAYNDLTFSTDQGNGIGYALQEISTTSYLASVGLGI